MTTISQRRQFLPTPPTPPPFVADAGINLAGRTLFGHRRHQGSSEPTDPGRSRDDDGGLWRRVVVGGVNAAGVEERLAGTGCLSHQSQRRSAAAARGPERRREMSRRGQFESCNIMSFWWSKRRAVGPSSSRNFPASGVRFPALVAGRRDLALASTAIVHKGPLSDPSAQSITGGTQPHGPSLAGC